MINVAGRSTRDKFGSAEQFLLDVLGDRGDQMATPLPWTLRLIPGMDCEVRRNLEVVDVLTAAITMIREPVWCQQRDRA
jgi:hypothetical protein